MILLTFFSVIFSIDCIRMTSFIGVSLIDHSLEICLLLILERQR